MQRFISVPDVALRASRTRPAVLTDSPAERAWYPAYLVPGK